MSGVEYEVSDGRGGRGAGGLLGRRVVVLGAGKVGSAAAVLLREAGYEPVAVTTRSLETAAEAETRTGAAGGIDNTAASMQGDIVLVATNDDAIATVVAEVAAADGFRPGQLVVHLSGALPLSVLAPAARVGARIGCLHPLQAFATAEDAVRTMPGSVFGVTPGPEAAEQVEELVRALGGESVLVADADKALYHAAAVMASNYLVAVEDGAVRLLMQAGFDEQSALRALRPLVAGTVDNVFRHGTTAALTGPIVRGDIDTVRGHIEALSALVADGSRASSDELSLYCALGRHALEIARRRGTLTPEQDAALLQLLSQA